MNYEDKYFQHIRKLPWGDLSVQNQEFLKEKAFQFLFSFQQLKELADFSLTFEMSTQKSLQDFWPLEFENELLEKSSNIPQVKKKLWSEIERKQQEFFYEKKDYSKITQKFKEHHPKVQMKFTPASVTTETILGRCPVASPKTRCCNLMTLDAVANCAYDCSYCSIQSFYKEGEVQYEENLFKKLKNYSFDPEKVYHIGTGQASDSLMLGNAGNILDDLNNFSKDHPNIIFELKTKSANIHYLVQNEISSNFLVTWSMTPQDVIDSEEHGTASFKERLTSARKVADKGILVGFHFHPIHYYNNFERDYTECVKQIVEMFEPHEVALVSMGTLTFTNEVLKQIRKRKIYSKILQLPLVDASGKLSYPHDIKMQLFQTVYQGFKPWHDHVFFYLCMEQQELWMPLFGYEYESNEEMEQAMLSSYMEKIAWRKKKRFV